MALPFAPFGTHQNRLIGRKNRQDLQDWDFASSHPEIPAHPANPVTEKDKTNGLALRTFGTHQNRLIGRKKKEKRFAVLG